MEATSLPTTEQAAGLPGPALPYDAAALWLGVSRRTLEKEVASGRIKVFRVGTRVQFLLSELNHYVARNNRLRR